MFDPALVWDFKNWTPHQQYIEWPTLPTKPTVLDGVDLQIDESIPLGEIHVVDQVTGQRQIIKVKP